MVMRFVRWLKCPTLHPKSRLGRYRDFKRYGRIPLAEPANTEQVNREDRLSSSFDRSTKIFLAT